MANGSLVPNESIVLDRVELFFVIGFRVLFNAILQFGFNVFSSSRACH